jgi:hypothetical protein
LTDPIVLPSGIGFHKLSSIFSRLDDPTSRRNCRRVIDGEIDDRSLVNAKTACKDQTQERIATKSTRIHKNKRPTIPVLFVASFFVAFRAFLWQLKPYESDCSAPIAKGE